MHVHSPFFMASSIYVLNKYQSLTHVSTCLFQWLFKKNHFNYFSLKVQKFHGDSVKNESARTKELQGGGRQKSHPSLFRVKAGITNQDKSTIRTQIFRFVVLFKFLYINVLFLKKVQICLDYILSRTSARNKI